MILRAGVEIFVLFEYLILALRLSVSRLPRQAM